MCWIGKPRRDVPGSPYLSHYSRPIDTILNFEQKLSSPKVTAPWSEGLEGQAMRFFN